MELFERAHLAVESTNLTDMDWMQYVVSEPSQERENLDGFSQRWDRVGWADDAPLGSLSPDGERDLEAAVELEFRESAFMQT